MGEYRYIRDYERTTMRQVADKELNEEFREALKYCPSLMIEAYDHFYTKKVGWFGSKQMVETRYSIYHETPAFDGSPYQARLQQSGSGSRAIVVAYLHGIINCGYQNEKNNDIKRT